MSYGRVDHADLTWRTALACNGGGCVARYSPGGQCMGRIPFPARAVSSCTFGGIEMGTLFVTTARQGAGADDQPDGCGALFAVETTAKGFPAGRLRLDG